MDTGFRKAKKRHGTPAFILAIFFLLVIFLPTTKLYKGLILALWAGHHPLEAYYFNFDDPALAQEIGNYYFGNGAYDLPKAAASYQLALRLQPGILWGHYQLARIYFVEGDFAKAMDEIDAELAANPGNLRSLYVRGLIETSQVNLPAAEADFKHFIEWAPTEWGGYNDLAFVLAKEGKYAESEATVEQAFAAVPNGDAVPWLWNSLGLAQLNELHYTQAQASFTKALALAEAITPEDWHRAYSGNDPAEDAAGIKNFQDAIKKNFATAQKDSIL